MSKKYYERVLKGTGIQSKKFHSSFGASILEKFGWKDGDGLGKERTGATNPLQIGRRVEFLGLGAKNPRSPDNQWNNWWDDLYNSTAEKVIDSQNKRKRNSSSSSVSSNDNSSSASSSDSSSDSHPSRSYFCRNKPSFQNKKSKKISLKEFNDSHLATSPATLSSSDTKGDGNITNASHKKTKNKFETTSTKIVSKCSNQHRHNYLHEDARESKTCRKDDKQKQNSERLKMRQEERENNPQPRSDITPSISISHYQKYKSKKCPECNQKIKNPEELCLCSKAENLTLKKRKTKKTKLE